MAVFHDDPLYSNASFSGANSSYGPMTSSTSVPEIDGALIPQVGLLILGLFIILGRRKENTEPLLAA